MRPKKLNPKKILKLVKAYLKERGQALINLCSKPKSRGRPKKYPDEIILTMLFLQKAWKLSFREIEDFAKAIFGEESIPDYSTYYYRLKQLPSLLLEDLIDYLFWRCIKGKEKNISYFIIDGTGFKYEELYPLKILRGTEIKKVRNHVKVVVLSVHFKNGKRVVVSAVAGKGYSNEIKLGGQVLQWISFEEAFRKIVEGKALLADKGYDSEDFICQVLSAGFKPYVKIRNQGIVRSEFRKVAQQFVDSDDLYKQRGRIEALFGEVKQALGSYERTKSFHIAVLFVLAKFVLFNLCAVFVAVIFQTLSS